MLRPVEAAAAIGVSRSKCYELIQSARSQACASVALCGYLSGPYRRGSTGSSRRLVVPRRPKNGNARRGKSAGALPLTRTELMSDNGTLPQTRNPLAQLTVDQIRIIRNLKISNAALLEALQVAIAMLAENNTRIDRLRRENEHLRDQVRCLLATGSETVSDKAAA